MKKKRYISPTSTVIAIPHMALLYSSTTSIFVPYAEQGQTDEALSAPMPALYQQGAGGFML